MLSWPDFDIMSFGCSYSMNMYLCILGVAFFYSWAVFGTGYYYQVYQLGTGGFAQKAEPVQGASPLAQGT